MTGVQTCALPIYAVVEVIPGERAVGRRQLAPDDFFFDGHFPGQPIVPAVILVELIAQTGGIAAASAAEPSNPILLRVAAIGPCKFPAAAAPGALLEVQARVVGRMGRLIKIEGEVTADGQVVASGSVTLAA